MSQPMIKAGIKQLRKDSQHLSRGDFQYVNAIGDLIERRGADVTVTPSPLPKSQNILMTARHESGIYYGYGTTIDQQTMDEVRFPGQGHRLNN